MYWSYIAEFTKEILINEQRECLPSRDHHVPKFIQDHRNFHFRVIRIKPCHLEWKTKQNKKKPINKDSMILLII